MKKLFVFISAVILLLSGLANAGQLEDVSNAYKNGDFVKAFRLVKPLALQGNATAQVILGGLYNDGQGVMQSNSNAADLFMKAANQGNVIGQYFLGNLYYQGKGVTQSYVQAVDWYRKSAMLGYAPAQYNLGLMYGQGKGVEHDDNQAVDWYRKSATQGYPDAQNNLGVMYAFGLGIPKDYIHAYMWANLATVLVTANDNTHPVKLRDSLAGQMTQIQIAQAQELSRACFAKKYQNCD